APLFPRPHGPVCWLERDLSMHFRRGACYVFPRSRSSGFPRNPDPRSCGTRGGTARKEKPMAGLYFEEFEEGQVFEHSISPTVTEMDNVLFSTLTMNPQPLHLDEEFAKQTEFGQRLVNSLFTLGPVIGMSVGATTLG